MFFPLAELMQQFKALKSAITTVTTAANARDDDEVERLQDVEVRIREVPLHDVHEGAAHVLTTAQS